MSERGFHADRLHPDAGNPMEVAFAKQWDEEHQFEHRRTIIHHLIGEDCSERDRRVAATVIQWLGSNVGMSFLEQVIRNSEDIQRYLGMRGLLERKQQKGGGV